MRKYKIRGQKRKWREIENWIKRSKVLDSDALENYGRDYCKIYVHPWSGLSLLNSATPEPNGKTKAKIVSGLIEIYESWRAKLEEQGEPYYLKIWLFEPRFSKSQVVCAKGDQLQFYDKTFKLIESDRMLNFDAYGRNSKALEKYNWQRGLDEDYYDENEPESPDTYASKEDYEWDVRFYKKLFRKPHTKSEYGKGTDNAGVMYVFNRGNVWIGGK